MCRCFLLQMSSESLSVIDVASAFIILPAVKKSDLAIQFGCRPEGHNDWIKGGV